MLSLADGKETKKEHGKIKGRRLRPVPCLVTLRPLWWLVDLSCGPGVRADPEILVSDMGQIFYFLAQNCAFWSSLTLYT